MTITRGQNGCFSYINNKKLFVPAVISDKVIDTIGAGDVFWLFLHCYIKLNQIN